MSGKTLTMLAVGDMFIRTEEAESQFALVAPVLRSADVVVGQGENPCTLRPVTTAAWSFATEPTGIVQPADPKNLKALHSAGFDVIHLAGNHIWDLGIPGIEDTIKELRDLGIAVVGAGMNIDEARKPAIIKRNGTRFGFLSYNCAGPRETYANPDKPGCAYVHIITAYELDQPNPGGNAHIYTIAEPRSLKAMVEDIENLRPLCDVLAVHFHKGLGYTPIKIAMYDQQVSYAAIDAGADLIVAEHAHILKGIEQYRGRTIFHGLCNFITGGRPATGDVGHMRAMWQLQERQRQLKELYGLDYDPEHPERDLLPEARQTIIAKCTVDDGKISRVSYLPCLINDQGQPEILKKSDKRGQQVYDYMDNITRAAGLNARYEWEGDEVVIRADYGRFAS